MDNTETVQLSSRTLGLLLDIELPITVSFGRAEMPLEELLKLTTGSIIELKRSIDDPVELRVNDSVIAHAKVVVVDGNYGIQIEDIASRETRLKTTDSALAAVIEDGSFAESRPEGRQ